MSLAPALPQIRVPANGARAVELAGQDPDPAFSLENFCAGEENRFALEVAKSLVAPSAASPRFVVLTGARATGKSHLAHAVTTAARAHEPGAPVIFLTGGALLQRTLEAHRRNALDNLLDDLHRMRRKARLMVVDDCTPPPSSAPSSTICASVRCF